jgi:hypothetical protein
MKLFHLRFIDLKDVDAFLWAGMKRAAATLLALVALSLPVFAATPNIQVKIQHFSATAPLDDQPVRLEAMAVASPVAVQRGFTDTDGQITFSSMPAGRYKLFLFHVPALELVIPDTSGTVQASSYVVTEGWTIATADDAGVIDLQSTQVLLLGNGLTKAGNTLQLSENVALDGSLSLSGETNRLTVEDGALKLDGEAVGGGGGESLWTTNSNGFLTPEEGFGGILRGAAAETIWTPVSGMFATALNDASLGEGSKWEFIHGSWQTNDWSGSYAYFDTFGDTNRASLDLEAYGNNGDWYYFLVQSAPDAGVLTAALRDSNGPKTLLDPSKAEPGASAAYIFDTISAVASGVISDTKNNGTAKHSIAFDGATTIAQSASEPAAPAAGYFTLFGIDNGSGKMILKVRFPTGASQTIATEP